jgi:hypothetical protein
VRLGIPSGVLPAGFPTKILVCIPLLPHSCYMPRPSHPPYLIILIILGEQYKLRSSSLCSFLQPPITISLQQKTFLQTNIEMKSTTYLLRYNATYSIENQLTFWRNISPPSSGSKYNPSKKPAWKLVASRLYCVISQMMVLFITIAVRT